MKITSLNFFIFLIISAITYYLFPKRIRWIVLLISSITFFLLSSSKVVGYFIFGVITSFIGALIIDKKCKNNKTKKITLFVTILLQLAELFMLKYINIIPNTISVLGNLFDIKISNTFSMNLIAPIGISYYTLSIISYVVDTYRGTIPAEKNIFKYTLFVCYYPCLISGPIIRYPNMKKELFNNNEMEWNNVFMGVQRIVYGLLKKMVIADNISILVHIIFENTDTYSGFYIILGTLLYAIQIYCDFSGCMDIAIGTSKIYGIQIPENFQSPFFSRNLSEFWRRWHITLGLWCKDYIMYPMLKSDTFQKFSSKLKAKFGKKVSKKVPVIIAILILWVFIGVWHGGSYKYVFAAGILPWIYLVLSEIFGEKIEKVIKKCKIHTEIFSYHLFQSIKTLFLMCIIWLFAIAPSLIQSKTIIRNIFKSNNMSLDAFLQENIFDDVYKFICVSISILLVVIVDYLIYKECDVNKKFNDQGVWFRYIILFGMISIILVYGIYGPGYSPAEFIYGGF